MQQVAMSGMQLDEVETDAIGPPRGGDKRLPDFVHSFSIKCQWRAVFGSKRNRRRADGLPAERIAGRQLSFSYPRKLGRCLSSGVRKLHAHGHLRPPPNAF